MKRSLRIVPQREKTELEKFAGFFHQDWRRCFPDIQTGVQAYVTTLSVERLAALADELGGFLRQNSDLPPKSLVRKWRRLGAVAWPPDLNLIDTLHDIIAMVAKPNNGAS